MWPNPKRRKMHLLPPILGGQSKMTPILRKNKYVNIIALGWMRAFFADYTFSPENNMDVEIALDAEVIENFFSAVAQPITVRGQEVQVQGVKVAVGIDFGSARYRDKGSKNVMWGPHFNPLSLSRHPSSKGFLHGIIGTESNYFHFLPKEGLFEEESVRMLKVLSKYDVDNLKIKFLELAQKYSSDVMFEFGKRFGCIRPKDDNKDHNRKILTEDNARKLDNTNVEKIIVGDYFGVMKKRQKSCELMLAEVMLYRFVCGKDQSPDPFTYFDESHVRQHLEDILTKRKTPMLIKAINGTNNSRDRRAWKTFVANATRYPGEVLRGDRRSLNQPLTHQISSR